MKRSHLAPLAAAGLLAATGTALAQVQLYGTVDVAAGQLESQPPGPPAARIAAVRGVHNGGVQTSYFGLRGTEDLGGGLRAGFQMEAFFRADTGAMGRFGPLPVQDTFFSRSAWVNLQGSWGDVKLGNVSNPAWLSMVFSSAMGSNSLFSPSFRQQYNGSTRGNNPLDTALPNSIAYTTPSLGGVMATVAVQAKEASAGSSNYVVNAVYRGGPLLLTGAYVRARHTPPPDPAAALDQNYFILGGSYDFGRARVFLQYAELEDNAAATKDKMPHVGVTVPVGASGELQAAWARDRTETALGGSRRTTASLGYIHRLSRRSSVYLMTTSDRVPVGNANSYVVGVRHDF